MSETAQGILELYATMWGKSLVCFPDYIHKLIEFWKTDQISYSELYTAVSYLIEKGYIYIT